MAKEYSRTETTHVDEVKRSAAVSLQWLVEPRALRDAATHPITHNNKLTLFICGEEGFGDIANEIGRAEKTIDMCCWGFDPGMELKRAGSSSWPRGPTYGDLIFSAAKRGVEIRILVWRDWVGSALVKNMPGYSHGGPYGFVGRQGDTNLISASNSIELLRKFNNIESRLEKSIYAMFGTEFPVPEEKISPMARAEYCHSWFKAVLNGKVKGVTMLMRSGKPDKIRRSLEGERVKPAGYSMLEIEEAGFLHMGTHHQKTILIDYDHEDGHKAVGYVMGLNSVTDYWDTVEHKLENPLREVGGRNEREESVQVTPPDAGFATLKPYQDYACRIDAGRSLIDVYTNFLGAWTRAGGNPTDDVPDLELLAANPPVALRRKARSGDSTVQVVRTQPEENDKSIQEAYWQATATAATTAGYIYIENQYFQCEHWAKHLLECRKDTISKWRKACQKSGKKREEMPILYLFIVIPVPERAQMVPRTYDTLATFGLQETMAGQSQMIKDWNKNKPQIVRTGPGTTAQAPYKLPNVVQHANSIDIPDMLRLENEYGLRVCAAMLNTCALENGKWRYREIYIHSKLMIANDIFFTLGSANANQRSFAVDSEINVAVQDRKQATALRQKVWNIMSGKKVSGGDGKAKALNMAFLDWNQVMNKNLNRKNSNEQSATEKKLVGFILPLIDKRSSIMRLG